MSPPRPVTLVQAHPHVPGPDHPCPGSGVPAAAVFLAETLGKTFDTGAHLASYAGLAPVTRRSGSSIRGEHVSHGGNKRLKRAMDCWGFFGQCLFCASGCLLQVQEIAFDLVRGAIP